jgi:hypothetical protein
MLEELIENGMSVARFNFSHGDHEGHKACLDRLRQAAANKKSHVGTYEARNLCNGWCCLCFGFVVLGVLECLRLWNVQPTMQRTNGKGRN